MLDHLLLQNRKILRVFKYGAEPIAMYGRHLIVFLKFSQFLLIWVMWYHYDWVNTYQIDMDGKFKYLSKTAQRTVHLISLDVLLDNNLQLYKAFTSNRKQTSSVNKHCRSGLLHSARPGCKTINLAASFSCALINKGFKMLTFLGRK